MNFSSPHVLAGFANIASLIQETKVLARSPAGFFLPGFQAEAPAVPPAVPDVEKNLTDPSVSADKAPLHVFAGS
jgi:hypothetical protein